MKIVSSSMPCRHAAHDTEAKVCVQLNTSEINQNDMRMEPMEPTCERWGLNVFAFDFYAIFMSEHRTDNEMHR